MLIFMSYNWLPIDRLPDRVKQKKREVEQLAINADDILEELDSILNHFNN